MRWLKVAVALAAVIAAWMIDPRLLGAVAIGAAIFVVGTAMLRSMAVKGETAPGPPEPVTDPTERTVFRCETCGTELLLVVRGDETPPRHCGERMHPRTEIPRN